MSTTAIARTPPFPVRQFTLDEYHRMVDGGVLDEADRVELLEGWIVPKMPRTPRHDSAIDQTHEVLRDLIPTGWRIRVQSAISTGDSEPEPDLAVVRGPAGRYVDCHPGPEDIALVVEVAESSLAHDREAKSRIYARAGIPTYWVLNLIDTRLEVYTGPASPGGNPGYSRCNALGPADRVPPPLEGQEVAPVAVRCLFPRA